METLVLGIGGMQSGACAGNIEKRLYGVHGVQSAVVSFELESAEIVYDPAQTNAAKLADAVVQAGYASSVPGAAAAYSAPVSAGHTNSGCG
jgi:copper chaperone CopZ